jgi:hypothetical protein
MFWGGGEMCRYHKVSKAIAMMVNVKSVMEGLKDMGKGDKIW